MPNPIKYSTTSVTGSYQKGNVAIGVNPISNGPTISSGWYNGVNPFAEGNFIVIEVTGADQPPRFYAPTTEAEWIRLGRQEGATGNDVSSITAVKNWFASQANYVVTNIEFPLSMPNVVGNGQLTYLNSQFTLSYPGSGVTWSDISGLGNDSTLSNGPTFNTGAEYIQFDGVDDYTSIPNPGDTGSIQFTYYWPGVAQAFIAGNLNGYAMLYNGGSGTVIHWFPASGTYDFGGNLPSRAGWYNITLTWGGTNDNKMYMNGALVMSSTAYSIAKPPTWYFAAGGGYTAQAIRLQSIQAYNKILTQAEVLQNHYKGNIVTDGLILALDAGNIVSYQEGTTDTYNLSGSSNSTSGGTLSVNLNGSLVNGVSYDSGNGGVWSFDGVDDYINLGNQSSLSFTNGIFSVDAWVYIPSTWTAGSQYPNLISKGATAGWDTDGWSMFVFRDYPGTQKSWGCGLRNGGAVDIIPRYNCPTDTWLHLTMTLNGSTVILYENGVKVNESTQTVSPASNSVSVLIGRDNNAQSFPGDLGSTKIYTKALSAVEVLQNFNAYRSRYGV